MRKILVIIVVVFAGIAYFKGMKSSPGRSSGNLGYVNPEGNMTPWRIDQGVDYNGPGPLYALGSGEITMVLRNAGWPGGTFIKLHLDSGPFRGRYVYYAEQITPSVGPGYVHAGQVIAECLPVKYCVEVGWGNASGDNTRAYTLGQSAPGIAQGDPGYYPTACGVQFSDMIKSLGGTPGLMQSSPVQGSSC